MEWFKTLKTYHMIINGIMEASSPFIAHLTQEAQRR